MGPAGSLSPGCLVPISRRSQRQCRAAGRNLRFARSAGGQLDASCEARPRHAHAESAARSNSQRKGVHSRLPRGQDNCYDCSSSTFLRSMCNCSSRSTQVQCSTTSVQRLSAAPVRQNLHSSQDQTSVHLISSFNSSGTMQPTCTWATLSSANSPVGKLHGCVINVHMGIPTGGRQLSTAGVVVQAVPNAKAISYASTTHLLLWRLYLLPTGTFRKTAAPQT